MNHRFLIIGLLLTSTAYALNPHMLIIGKTGSGKSTLINMIGHKAKGEAYNEPRKFLIPITSGGLSYRASHSVGVAAANDSTTSQTETISLLQVAYGDGGITLIDTPGLLDTRAGREELNKENLQIHLATNPINTIALVIPAGDMRETEQVIRIFNNFLDLFPSRAGVLRNTVVLVTFTGQPDDNIMRLAQNHLTGLNPDQFFFFDNTPLIVRQGANLNLGQATWDSDQAQIESLLQRSLTHESINTTFFRDHQRALALIGTSTQGILQQIIARNERKQQHEALERQIIQLENMAEMTSEHTTTQTVTVQVSVGTRTEKGSHHGASRPTYTKCNACGGQNHVCTKPEQQSVTVVNQGLKDQHEAIKKKLAALKTTITNVSRQLTQSEGALLTEMAGLQAMVDQFIGDAGQASLNVRVLRNLIWGYLSQHEPGVSADPIFQQLQESVAR